MSASMISMVALFSVLATIASEAERAPRARGERKGRKRDEEAFVCCLLVEMMAMVDGDGDGVLGKERRFSEFGKSKEGRNKCSRTLSFTTVTGKPLHTN